MLRFGTEYKCIYVDDLSIVIVEGVLKIRRKSVKLNSAKKNKYSLSYAQIGNMKFMPFCYDIAEVEKDHTSMGHMPFFFC